MLASGVQVETGAETGPHLTPLLAFAQLEPRIRAVPRSALLTMNVDGQHVVKVVLDAAPKFLTLRPRMLTLGPELNRWLIDHCVPLAHGYSVAASRFIPADEARAAFKRARAEGLVLRRRLRSQLRSLIESGALPGKVHLELHGRSGHAQLAKDLTTLARVFAEEKAELSGKTAIEWADIMRADEIATRLLTDCTRQRERSPAEEEAALLKQQAYTLLRQAYREVRRAVCFLRDAEGDAEDFAPLLYAGRSG